MAVFIIRDTFTLSSRNLFVVVGEIVEGIIAENMTIEKFGYKIMAVEFVDGLGERKSSYPALVLKYKHEIEKIEMQSNLLPDSVLNVH